MAYFLINNGEDKVSLFEWRMNELILDQMKCLYNTVINKFKDCWRRTLCPILDFLPLIKRIPQFLKEGVLSLSLSLNTYYLPKLFIISHKCLKAHKLDTKRNVYQQKYRKNHLNLLFYLSPYSNLLSYGLGLANWQSHWKGKEEKRNSSLSNQVHNSPFFRTKLFWE